jgi:hypothetical protein
MIECGTQLLPTVNAFKRDMFALFHGAIGAYVGAVAFCYFGALVQSIVDPWPQATLGKWPEEIVVPFELAAAGCLAMSWWIIPISIIFGHFLVPRILLWPASSATMKGFQLGAALGFITAILFALIPPPPPRLTLVVGYLFLPLYCGVWCALYSRWHVRDRETAKRIATTS